MGKSQIKGVAKKTLIVLFESYFCELEAHAKFKNPTDNPFLDFSYCMNRERRILIPIILAYLVARTSLQPINWELSKSFAGKRS